MSTRIQAPTFAVCRRRIEAVAVQAAAAEAREQRHLTSNLWLTSTQAHAFYGTRIYDHCLKARISYALKLDLKDLNLSPDVTPLSAALEPAEANKFLKKHEVPASFPRHAMLLHDGQNWIPLPERFRTFASFAFGAKPHERPLFLPRRYDAFFEQPAAVVDLFNAQSATNPFLIDTTLFHVCLFSPPF